MDLAVADRIIKRGLELRNVPGFGAESTIDAKKIDLSSPIASPFMGPKDIPKANVKIKVVDRDNFNGGNT